MNRKDRVKFYVVLGIAFIVVFTFIVLNTPLTTRKGINGILYTYKIPIYVKAINFLSRHVEFKQVANDIVAGCSTEEERLMAIFNWVIKNIKHQPRNLPVVDDHVLNIIIRGYAKDDQFEDVFTTLCVYADIPAFYEKIYAKDNSRIYTYMSFAKLKGRWRVFDVDRANMFFNGEGNLATIEELIEKPQLANKVHDKSDIAGIRYIKFIENLTSIPKRHITRPYKQMPMGRLKLLLKNLFGTKR